MFDGIEWVAKIERATKKKAARLLIERGFSSWLSEKIKEELAIKKLESEPHLTRFVLELRKLAKERGTDSEMTIWPYYWTKNRLRNWANGQFPPLLSVQDLKNVMKKLENMG